MTEVNGNNIPDASQYNMRSPGVKRLMKEAAELRNPTDMYYAQPLEDNLFEWHFTVRGPADTDFDGGIYHGRILLPVDYPMKPPSVILLTPNGRFQLNQKICLSISGHHPESWQPSWSIRTALLALIGFMPTHSAGALGSLEYPPSERKKLAIASRDWTCAECGLRMCDALLERNSQNTSSANGDNTSASGNNGGAAISMAEEARSLAKQISFKNVMDIAAGTEDEGGRGDHVARLDTSRIDGETCDGGTNASGRSATAVSPTESMEQEWNGTNRLQTREGAAAIVPEPEQAESGKAMGLGDGTLNSAEGSEPGVSATSSGAAGMISSSFGETTEAGYGREGTGRADRAGVSANRVAVGGTASNAASNTTRGIFSWELWAIFLLGIVLAALVYRRLSGWVNLASMGNRGVM